MQIELDRIRSTQSACCPMPKSELPACTCTACLWWTEVKVTCVYWHRAHDQHALAQAMQCQAI